MGKAVNLGHLLGGLILGAFGLLILVIGLLGLVDPSGTKLSDDADPFGPTSMRDYIWSIILLICGIGTTFAGTYLIWRTDNKI